MPPSPPLAVIVVEPTFIDELPPELVSVAIGCPLAPCEPALPPFPTVIEQVNQDTLFII